MLNTLKGYKPEEIEDLLSEVIEDFLPNPEASSPQSNKLPSDLREKILEEVVTHLGLQIGDKSPEAKSRILEYLTEEIANQVLATANLHDIKNRVRHINFAA
jgi:hypothetical protein